MEETKHELTPEQQVKAKWPDAYLAAREWGACWIWSPTVGQLSGMHVEDGRAAWKDAASRLK